MKTYLLAISLISLFLISFTSCEKDDMDKGLGGGGGMQDAVILESAVPIPVSDALLEAD